MFFFYFVQSHTAIQLEIFWICPTFFRKNRITRTKNDRNEAWLHFVVSTSVISWMTTLQFFLREKRNYEVLTNYSNTYSHHRSLIATEALLNWFLFFSVHEPYYRFADVSRGFLWKNKELRVHVYFYSIRLSSAIWDLYFAIKCTIQRIFFKFNEITIKEFSYYGRWGTDECKKFNYSFVRKKQISWKWNWLNLYYN